MPIDLGFYTTRPKEIPVALPFELFVDPSTGLIRERISPELRAAMKRFYELGGYASTPVGEGGYATSMGDSFLRAFDRALSIFGQDVAGLEILEVGCAYGYLLHKLQERGARTTGVEPGEEGIQGSKQYHVTILRDFFPTAQLKGRQFDVVLSHGVLEHIEDLEAMLAAMIESTKEGGLIFCAMPECEKKFAKGDLSIISHQHSNYFTADSARAVMIHAGLNDVGVLVSPRRAILFAWGRKRGGTPVPMQPKSGDTLLSAFKTKFFLNVQAIQLYVNSLEKAGKTIGLYAPDANLAALIRYAKPPRIFNSDEKKHGKYLVPSAGAFESPEELIAAPVDALIVAPIDYDSEIRDDLRKRKLPSSTEIFSLKELYERTSGSIYSIDSMTKGEEFVVA